MIKIIFFLEIRVLKKIWSLKENEDENSKKWLFNKNERLGLKYK